MTQFRACILAITAHGLSLSHDDPLVVFQVVKIVALSLFLSSQSAMVTLFYPQPLISSVDKLIVELAELEVS